MVSLLKNFGYRWGCVPLDSWRGNGPPSQRWIGVLRGRSPTLELRHGPNSSGSRHILIGSSAEKSTLSISKTQYLKAQAGSGGQLRKLRFGAEVVRSQWARAQVRQHNLLKERRQDNNNEEFDPGSG